MAGESKTLTIRLIGNAKGGVKALKATEKASESLSSRMGKASGTLKDVGRSTMQWGTRLTAVTAGVAYFVAKAGAPYVASLNKIQTLTNSSDAQMKKAASTLEANAGLYAKMGQTTGDAASGVVELTKSGLSLDKAMKAVNGTMILAKAGELDVADASTLVANTLNTFNLKAGRAADVANMLANAANISSADVKDLRYGLAMSANVAAGTGIKFDELVGTLAAFSNAGLQGSDAGTSLKTMLMNLVPTTTKTGKLFDKLGFSAFDSKGNFVGMAEAAKRLHTALKGYSKEERMVYMKTMFGNDAIRAANILYKEGGKGIETYIKGVRKQGAAQKLAQSASKGLAGTWASLKAQLTSLAQGLYREFSPVLDGILKKVAGLMQGFSKASPGVKKIAIIFGLLFAAAGPVLLILGALATGLGVLLSPVGLVVAAIAAVVAVLAIAYAKSAAFREAVSKIGEAIKPLAKAFMDFAKSMLPPLKELGSKLMDTLGPALTDIGNLIAKELIPAFVKLLPIIKPIAIFLLKMFGSAVIGAIKGVIQVIKGVVQVIAGVFNLVSDLIHGRWGAVWHDLGMIVKGALNIVIGIFKVWWNVGVLSIFRRGFTAVVGLFKGGFKGLVRLAKGGIKGLDKALAKVFRVLSAPFRAGFRAVRNFVSSGWAFIRGKSVDGILATGKVLNRIKQVVTYPFRVALSTAKTLVSRGISAVVTFFRNTPGRIARGLSRIKGAVTGALRGAVGWLWNAGQNIIKGLLQGIGSMIGQVEDKFRKLTNMIPDWKGPAKRDATLLQPAGESIMGGFMKGLAGKFGHVRRMLGGFTSSLAGSASGPSLAGAGGAPLSTSPGGYLRGSAGGRAIVVHVTVEGNVIGEKDFARRVTPTVRDELSKIGNRNGGKIFD